MNKHRLLTKIIAAFLFFVGIILAWGGIIYATYDMNNIRLIGLFAAVLGYGIIPGAVYLFETDPAM